MPTHDDAVALAEVTFANATTEGDAVVFGLKGHDGVEYKFACPPDAISTLVARLLAAHGEVAMVKAIEPKAIVTKKSQIGIDNQIGAVLLSLFPASNTPIVFALTPHHAQKVSSHLAEASATLEPRTPGKQH